MKRFVVNLLALAVIQMSTVTVASAETVYWMHPATSPLPAYQYFPNGTPSAGQAENQCESENMGKCVAASGPALPKAKVAAKAKVKVAAKAKLKRAMLGGSSAPIVTLYWMHPATSDRPAYQYSQTGAPSAGTQENLCESQNMGKCVSASGPSVPSSAGYVFWMHPSSSAKPAYQYSPTGAPSAGTQENLCESQNMGKCVAASGTSLP